VNYLAGDKADAGSIPLLEQGSFWVPPQPGAQMGGCCDLVWLPQRSTGCGSSLLRSVLGNRLRAFGTLHPLRLAVYSLCQYNTGEQSCSRIHSRLGKLASVVVAQGAPYCRQGLDRQGDESGI
jgi:hypothetical protein